MNVNVFNLASLYKKGVLPKKAVSHGTCTGCLGQSSGPCKTSDGQCVPKPPGSVMCPGKSKPCTGPAPPTPPPVPPTPPPPGPPAPTKPTPGPSAPTKPTPGPPAPTKPTPAPAAPTPPPAPSPGPAPGPGPVPGDKGLPYNYENVVLHKKTIDDIKNLEKKYEKYIAQGSIPLTDIKRAWIDAGMNPALCKYALIIVAGECGSLPPGGPEKSCALTGTTNNASGIFQCDSCQDANSKSCNAPSAGSCVIPPNGPFVKCSPGMWGDNCELNLKNPVSNIYAVVNTVLFPEHGLNKGYANSNKGCGFSYGFAKNPDKDNFIGPFCHKGYVGECENWDNGYCTKMAPATFQEGSPVFNGGGNKGQLPFPRYYYNRFLTRIGFVKDKISAMHDEEIKSTAEKEAEKLCLAK